MTNYTPRIAVSEQYVTIFGQAAYNFTYLEAAMVWVGETLNKGFIERSYNQTSLQIANALGTVIENMDGKHPLKSRLAALAERFVELAYQRNRLLHARPYTATGGEQRLAYRGRQGQDEWPIEHIADAAFAFEKAAIEAGDLLHAGGLYATYESENCLPRDSA